MPFFFVHYTTTFITYIMMRKILLFLSPLLLLFSSHAFAQTFEKRTLYPEGEKSIPTQGYSLVIEEKQQKVRKRLYKFMKEFAKIKLQTDYWHVEVAMPTETLIATIDIDAYKNTLHTSVYMGLMLSRVSKAHHLLYTKELHHMLKGFWILFHKERIAKELKKNAKESEKISKKLKKTEKNRKENYLETDHAAQKLTENLVLLTQKRKALFYQLATMDTILHADSLPH